MYHEPTASPGNTPSRFTNFTAFGTGASTVKTGAGRLYAAIIINTSATAYFVQFFDTASAPVNGDVPIWERRISASAELFANFDPYGLVFASGMRIAISSTATTLTYAVGDNAICCGWVK